MLDEQFMKQRASMVRDLASRADPFIKRRLLDLAARYEDPERGATPVMPANLQIKSQNKQATEQ